MDRVSKIVALEGRADVGERKPSAQRWAASKLIYEALQETTLTQLSVKIKAAGGRASLAHLTFMRRCWDLVVIRQGLTDPDFEGLPNFGSIYQSDEVRRSGRGMPRKRRGTDREPRSARSITPVLHETASTWIKNADEALSLLAEHRISWRFLTDEDIETLKGIPERVEDIVELLESRRASA